SGHFFAVVYSRFRVDAQPSVSRSDERVRKRALLVRTGRALEARKSPARTAVKLLRGPSVRNVASDHRRLAICVPAHATRAAGSNFCIEESRIARIALPPVADPLFLDILYASSEPFLHPWYPDLRAAHWTDGSKIPASA